MHLVIVESPAKSRTINKYLGSNYTVLASMGHIRDLPSKDGSVRPDEDFAMTYEIDSDKGKTVQAIAKEAKGAESILLATDPDREGEAISWHVLEMLKEKKAIKPGTIVKRVVFNEITKKAVQDGIKNARELDMDLINAQQARRALDYLVGFTLSPVLWRKLPGSRSAGRVQSVALRIICDREDEIEAFRSEEYWDLQGEFLTPRNESFKARLTHYNGEKVEKFSFRNEKDAHTALAALKAKHYSIASVTPKQAKRNPYAPFTTSTLQQEAARKLHFSSKRTMQIAQKLYEGVNLGGETTGLITYMRTDGVYVAVEAIHETRGLIGETFGKSYVPEAPRHYTAKAKNAQEAHEAIRPTSVRRTPESVAQFLDDDQLKLYTLIWKRMVASQMASCILDQLVVEITSGDHQAEFRATGSVVKFPGFTALYNESKDDEEDEESRMLPEVHDKETLKAKDILTNQHFTEPPPRFSEASLVKKLEELGIGRPSTYASIISVLQDREYVRLDKKRFIPEERGRIVTAFLKRYFARYVEFHFTAGLEEQLDNIAEGKIDWKAVLRAFWTDFSSTTDETKELLPSAIIKEIEIALEAHLFPPRTDGTDPRACPKCAGGQLGLKAGKFGAFLGCSNYPECGFTRQLSTGGAEGGTVSDDEFPKALGKNGEGQEISLRKGPYGLYVQLDDGGEKPKRASLPKGMTPDAMTLAAATDLLALPRTVGTHPETGKVIKAGLGRFGPYIAHDGVYASIPADESVLTIGMNRAVTLLAEKQARGSKGSAAPLRIIGKHDGDDVAVYSGKYGPYVKFGKTNATLPKSLAPESVTLEEAMKLIEEKGGSTKGKASKGKAKKAAPKAKAAPKTAAKPKTAKKASPAAKTAKSKAKKAS